MTKLPKGWINVPLSRLGTWVGGGTPSTTRPEFWDGDIPWVSPKDMKTDKIDQAIDNITELAVANSAAAVVPSGSILIVTRSGILAHTLPVAVNTVRVAINQDLKALTPLEGLSPNYVRLVLQAHGRAILKACVKDGTTVHSVKVPSLLAYQVPLPPIPEQHRIVARVEELFSELDASVESLTKAKALLGLYRQSLLKAAFQGKLTADWRAANPDKLETPETLLARIRKDREARYAKALDDWQTALSEWRNKGEKGRKPARPTPPAKMDGVRLEGKVIAGGWMTLPLGWFIDEPTYGTAKKCSYESAGLGVLRIPNISDGSIDPTDLKFADFDEDEIEAYRLEAGDILIIRSNGSISIVGKAAVVTKAHEQLLFAGYLIRLRPIMSLLNSRFQLRVLESHDLRKQIEEKAKSTSGVNNISAAEIKGLMVPVCSIDEQVEVDRILEEKLSVIDQSLIEITAALTRISALRQSILKRAFSGRLVPQDPSDEPASALLARLQSQSPATPTRRRGGT